MRSNRTTARQAAHVCVRVNPELSIRAFGLKMGGRAVQFGIEENILDDAFKSVCGRAPLCRFRDSTSMQAASASKPDGVIEGVRNTLAIVRAAEARSRTALRVVNLGGGFGVAHTEARSRARHGIACRKIYVPRPTRIPAVPAQAAKGRFRARAMATANAGIYVPG